MRLLPAPALVFALLLLACGEAPSGPPNVVLITLDTLRADRLGSYGYARDTTPHLDALAERGVRFEDAIAQSTTTSPSHASILTGLDPPRHGLRKLYGERLAESNETLAEMLGGHGYTTAAFVSAIPLRRSVGLDQGFETYDDRWDESRGETGAGPLSERSAFETNRRVKAWLETAPKRPFFLWVHYFDPHHPYFPPESWRLAQGVEVDTAGSLPGALDASRSRPDREPDEPPEAMVAQGMSQLYDAEVAYTDAAVGELLEALDDADALDRSIVAVVADHGEHLGEHGYWFGHWDVLDETARVPMLLVHPDGRHAGQAVEASVGTIDLVPTLLAWLGIESGVAFDGRDLTPLLAGAPPAPRVLYTEQFEFFPVRSVRDDGWLLREQSAAAGTGAGPARRLQPRSAPRRTQGRVDAATARRLRSALRAISQRPADHETVHETVKVRLPEEVRAQLRALGYTNDAGESTGSKASDRAGGADEASAP
jgi:arylsulfatase A-like enzyme